jgi:hypothetical protein
LSSSSSSPPPSSYGSKSLHLTSYSYMVLSNVSGISSMCYWHW